jgi:hypothetical protein
MDITSQFGQATLQGRALFHIRYLTFLICILIISMLNHYAFSHINPYALFHGPHPNLPLVNQVLPVVITY